MVVSGSSRNRIGKMRIRAKFVLCDFSCQNIEHMKHFYKHLEDMSPFWWWLHWFSKLGWICHLCDLSLAWNGFLRFTSGATPADLLTASMTAEPFDPFTCTCIYKHLWDTRDRVRGSVWQACYRLSHTGSAEYLRLFYKFI